MRWEEVKPYAGRVVGITLGIVAGIIYLVFGFWKALIFTLIVLIGYYFGKRSDRQESWIPPTWAGWLLATGERIKKRWAEYKADKSRSKWR